MYIKENLHKLILKLIMVCFWFFTPNHCLFIVFNTWKLKRCIITVGLHWCEAMPSSQQHFPNLSLALLWLLTGLPNSKHFYSKGHFHLDQWIHPTPYPAAKVGLWREEQESICWQQHSQAALSQSWNLHLILLSIGNTQSSVAKVCLNSAVYRAL